MKKILKWKQLFLLLLMGTSLVALQACSENDDDEIVLENGNVLVNDHEAVDLGLSVKWATCNLGSETPEGSGNCYAWGETKVKDNCSWSTYDWCNGANDKLTKYCINSDYGTVDNVVTLSSSDDAATAAWGKKWRMPTQSEIKELVEECVWTWLYNGYNITGPNGKTIFLPMTGYRDGASINGRGSNGSYWSSSLDASNNDCAYYIDFHSDGKKDKSANRYLGCAIRPVTGDTEMSVPKISEISRTEKGKTVITSGTSITLSATITSDGYDKVTERGFCFSSKHENPRITDEKIIVTSENFNFSGTIAGLKRGSTYHICAYAVNSQGVGYSAPISFIVPSLVNDYEAVDLGLSVKWATFNYGAAAPEETGNFVHLWGAFEDGECWENWHTPTKDEMNELLYDCTWEWTTYNGVNGQLVTGPNGNSIFLPAAGWIHPSCRNLSCQQFEGGDMDVEGAGEQGVYMTSDYYNAYYNVIFKRTVLSFWNNWITVEGKEISHYVQNISPNGHGVALVMHRYQGGASIRLVTN